MSRAVPRRVGGARGAGAADEVEDERDEPGEAYYAACDDAGDHRRLGALAGGRGARLRCVRMYACVHVWWV